MSKAFRFIDKEKDGNLQLGDILGSYVTYVLHTARIINVESVPFH